MMRFIAGFAVASLLWIGFLFAYRQGLVGIDLEPEKAQQPSENARASNTTTTQSARGRKRSYSPNAKNKRGSAALSGESSVGDNLGENETRTVDMNSAGGEAQLTTLEIEQGFDAVFPQLRRCLALAAGEDPVRGKLIFGLRISGQGKVSAVNLRGPSAVTLGDAGSCLRTVTLSMHFRQFRGPDMVVHYPITLE